MALFRDLNGGFLEKAVEMFHLLEEATQAPQEELRQFFYSITPQEAQATTSISLLKTLYLNMKKQREQEDKISYQWKEVAEGICISLVVPTIHFERRFRKFLHHFSLYAPIIARKEHKDTIIIGCIFKSLLQEDKKKLQAKLKQFYDRAVNTAMNQVLNLAVNTHFSSFDPRIGTDEETHQLHRMLFEGLMRLGKGGVPELALAERVEKLDGGKRYRFFLKKSVWSNKMPLTAHDFVHSWQNKTSSRVCLSFKLSLLLY